MTNEPQNPPLNAVNILTPLPDAAARWALPALIAGALAIAWSPNLVRLSELEPVATAFYRVTLALPFIWVWMVAFPQKNASETILGKQRLFWMAFTGVSFAGDLACWHWALKFTSVANSTLLANFAPIVVTAGAWLLLGERVTKLFILGLAVALLGAGVLIGLNLAAAGDAAFGDFLALVTAVFYGGYMIGVRKLRSGGVSSAQVMLVTTFFTALTLLPLTVMAGESFVANTWQGWAVLIALAGLTHAGGQGLIAYAFAHLPASFGSVTLLVQPVAAAIIAWLLFGEALSPLELAGGVLVLMGIWLARKASA